MDIIDKIYKQIGENDANQDVTDWLGTGLLHLNEAISGHIGGGVPAGRIIEIYGGPSSGKTLLATMIMIETQKKGGIAIFLDHEHAFSISRAKTLGLSDDRSVWIYKQPDTAEDSFAIIEFVCDILRKDPKYKDKHITIIVDSVAHMVTKSELETDYGDENMKTRLSLPVVMSTSLKKVSAKVSKTNATLVFLNQTRVNPTVMFGDKESQPGGNALKFTASVRIKLRKGAKVKDDASEIIGEAVHAEVVKNKVFEPFKTTEYVTHFQNGINLELSHIEELHRRKLLGNTQGWLELDGKKYRKAQLVELCKSDAKAYSALLSKFAA
jgi:recombination protein RecA